MTTHYGTEILSSYVDDELKAAERSAIDRHLDDCARCREELAGLKRVVRELGRLGEASPPAEIGYQVKRAIRLEREPTILRRTENTLRRWLQQPSILPLFGVIVAMAVFIYLLAVMFEDATRRPTRVIVPPPLDPGATDFVIPGAATRAVGGLVFVRTADGWRQADLDGEPARVLSLSTPDPAHPTLEVFRDLGGSVDLAYRGEAVRVVFEAD